MNYSFKNTLVTADYFRSLAAFESDVLCFVICEIFLNASLRLSGINPFIEGNADTTFTRDF
jgi:hypothetical protein